MQKCVKVCQWVLAAWQSIKTSTIENGFRNCGLLSAAAEADESSDEEVGLDEARQQIIDMLEENSDMDSSFDGFEDSDEEEDKN